MNHGETRQKQQICGNRTLTKPEKYCAVCGYWMDQFLFVHHEKCLEFTNVLETVSAEAFRHGFTDIHFALGTYAKARKLGREKEFVTMCVEFLAGASL